MLRSFARWLSPPPACCAAPKPYANGWLCVGEQNNAVWETVNIRASRQDNSDSLESCGARADWDLVDCILEVALNRTRILFETHLDGSPLTRVSQHHLPNPTRNSRSYWQSTFGDGVVPLAAARVVAATRSGELRGFVKEDARVFLGVPFASLAERYARPAPVAEWSEPLECAAPGATRQREVRTTYERLSDDDDDDARVYIIERNCRPGVSARRVWAAARAGRRAPDREGKALRTDGRVLRVRRDGRASLSQPQRLRTGKRRRGRRCFGEETRGDRLDSRGQVQVRVEQRVRALRRRAIRQRAPRLARQSRAFGDESESSDSRNAVSRTLGDQR